MSGVLLITLAVILGVPCVGLLMFILGVEVIVELVGAILEIVIFWD